MVTAFLLTELNVRMQPKYLALKPGTRIVAYAFKMGDWAPDETVNLGCGTFCSAHLWIVPARVEGVWRLPRGELTLAQEFQNVYGTLRRGTEVMSIVDGRLRGAQIGFTVGGARYTGRVGTDTMEGTVGSGGVTRNWGAVRLRAL